VTEERYRKLSENGSNQDILNLKEGLPDIDFAHEDDYYRVLEEGSLEGLIDHLGYVYGEEAELIDLVSYVIEYIASRQIFGNGNKRTSFITGYLILFMYQVINGYDEISVPRLTDDFVELISNVANDQKDESKEDIEDYLSGLKQKLEQQS